MRRTGIMLIAGEPSGDLLAAELVQALKMELVRHPRAEVGPLHFFGAGGPQMAAAGVELAFDMTRHAVVGLFEVLKNYGKFRRLFYELLRLAVDRQPGTIICVDFSGFNRRFAAAVRKYERHHGAANWHPRIIQYVSPQVWASRPRRAEKMAKDLDLLLTIFPFEKSWYAERVPNLRVEFVGHPILDRYSNAERGTRRAKAAPECSGVAAPPGMAGDAEGVPTVLLLPGSRRGELRCHIPVMLAVAKRLQAGRRIQFLMILPNRALLEYGVRFIPTNSPVQLQNGGLSEALSRACIAIASTGTVTLECAYFGVPTVAIYKTSWSTYWIGRSIIRVKYLAMPNLLADEPLFPEFIQQAATADRIADEALELICDENRRQNIQSKLARVIRSLGEPGASQRAASAVRPLLGSNE